MVQCWLVERSYGSRNLITLVYATPDGERQNRKEMPITADPENGAGDGHGRDRQWPRRTSRLRTIQTATDRKSSASDATTTPTTSSELGSRIETREWIAHARWRP
ncbi:MAG: hypothetical protein U5K28_01965 [Halobacteriales archaeon]|nr:hypothetical protein [Halobacteriales archaeon]